jgi:succinate dehydrogenase / fumarate reductase cytochrome b subunit
MENKNKRPVFLNLLAIRQPVGAVVSLLHRLTGALLVLLVAPGLYVLERSLRSPEAFEGLMYRLSTPAGRALILLTTWLFAQHLFSGVRHLLLDMDVGAGLRAARASAWSTFAASAVVVLLAGVRLW